MNQGSLIIYIFMYELFTSEHQQYFVIKRATISTTDLWKHIYNLLHSLKLLIPFRWLIMLISVHLYLSLGSSTFYPVLQDLTNSESLCVNITYVPKPV